MIPRILHFMWLDKKNPYQRGYPEQYRKNVDKWIMLNPEWRVIVWNWTDVEKEFPEWMEVLNSIPIWISKCDFARFLVLYKYGGVYLDLDIIAQRPLDDYVTDREYLLVFEPREHMEQLNEGLLFNGLVGCQAQDPFIMGWVKKMAEDAPKNDNVSKVVSVTGPTGFYNYWRETGIPVEELDTCLFLPVTKEDVNSPFSTYIPKRCSFYSPYCMTRWHEGTFWYVQGGNIYVQVAIALIILLIIYKLLKNIV